MMKGRNNGKKLLAVRIVAHAFEIIHLLTDQNPIQVRAVIVAPGPCGIAISASPLAELGTLEPRLATWARAHALAYLRISPASSAGY